MPALARRSVEAYLAAVDRAGAAAESAVRAALADALAANPHATVAQMREYARALLAAAGGRHGARASEAAYAIRSIAAEAAGIAGLPAVPYSYSPDPGGIDEIVRYQAGKLAAGDGAGFVAQVARAARGLAERGANETMLHAGEADAARLGRRVRFARVNGRPDPCEWCLMLCSRGFVYHDKLRAAAAAHRNCSCRIVEGFGGDAAIEGHDPAALRDRWQEKRGERLRRAEGAK